jgi:Domain of unknown function (DUF5118)
MSILANICRVAFLIMIATMASSEITAQDPPATSTPPAGAQDRPSPPGFGREPEIKPYDRVITKEAKSDEGIFTVHRIKEKVFYEIPKEQLNKEFL